MSIFFEKNKIFLFLILINQIAIWSYASLLPMVLSKHYNFSDTFLSYTVTSFLIFFFLGMTYTNLKLDNKLNYTNYLLFGFLGLFSLTLFQGFQIDNLNNKYIYIVLRSFEGFFHGYITILLSFIFKSILVKENKNGLIHSLVVSFGYLVKATLPIFISAFLLFQHFEIVIYWYASFIYLVIILFILYNKKIFSFKYQLRLRKSQGKSNNNSLKVSLFGIKHFYKDNIKLKIYYTFLIVVQNLNRPFYDLYMVLLLINYYDFSILNATFILSFMVFGQASQVIPGYLSDKIRLDIFRLIGIILYSTPIVIIIFFPNIFNNIILSCIIFFIFGVGRSFYASFDHKINMILIKEKTKINHISLIQNIIGEFTHYFSYILLGSILWIGLDIKELFYFSLIIVILIYFAYFVFDRKYFNKIY